MPTSISTEKHFSVLLHLQKQTQYGINPDLVVFFQKKLADTPVQALLSLRLVQADAIEDTDVVKETDKAFRTYLSQSLEKRNSREFIDQTLWGANLEDERCFSTALHLDALLRSGVLLLEIQDTRCCEGMVRDIDRFLATILEEQDPRVKEIVSDFQLLREQFRSENLPQASETVARVIKNLQKGEV